MGREVTAARAEGDRRLTEADERFLKFQAENSEMIQPGHSVGVTIRLRFHYNFRRLMGLKNDKYAPAIVAGNIAAHYGDFVVDTLMMRRGDLTDTETFLALYGIAYKDAEPFTKIVAIINERATIVANPLRFSQKWDEIRQRQFSEIISNFINPSTVVGEECLQLPPLQSTSTKVQNQEIGSLSSHVKDFFLNTDLKSSDPDVLVPQDSRVKLEPRQGN
ncbi:hypothetical protein HOY82DRAFT_534638 [Tuber indicum]|nr:hypothetical protein HOY82DRAFT_534638 [Tuber indicum]